MVIIKRTDDERAPSRHPHSVPSKMTLDAVRGSRTHGEMREGESLDSNNSSSNSEWRRSSINSRRQTHMGQKENNPRG